ncbi:MAG TPA: HDOD domain-containing protein [Terriglobia bacterium]
MHDVGRLALTVVEPARYSNLILEAEGKALNVLDRERELFGVDHCEAGSWLAEQWKLPPHFAEVAAHHHEPCKPGKVDMVSLVQVACRLADCIGFSAVRPLNPLSFDSILLELPSAAHKRLAFDQSELTFKVAMKINSVE